VLTTTADALGLLAAASFAATLAGVATNARETSSVQSETAIFCIRPSADRRRLYLARPHDVSKCYGDGRPFCELFHARLRLMDARFAGKPAPALSHPVRPR
jgi:hypothetical protein